MRFLAVLLCLAPIAAAAQVPNRLGYQGRLLRTDGAPESGVVAMTFALFDAPTGGSPVACDAAQVALSDGFYSILLGGLGNCPGGGTAITGAVFDGRELHLELTVNGFALSPRQRVGTVAYAHRAGTAVNVRGGTVEATAVTVGGATGVAITSTGVSLGANTVVDASGKATVASGAGLTGDGSTASPLAVATDGVTSGMLRTDAAALSKVSGGAMTAAAGNVAIGTAAGADRLVVDRTTAGPLASFVGENHSAGDPATRIRIRDQTGGVDWFVSANNDGKFAVHQGGVGDRLTVSNAGSVGVGSGAPFGTFDVLSRQGGTAGSAVATLGHQVVVGGPYNAPPNTGGVKLWIGDYDNDGTVVYPIYVEDENNYVDFYLRAATTEGGLGTVYMRGNVGIGTTTPGAKLDVAGTVAASGRLQGFAGIQAAARSICYGGIGAGLGAPQSFGVIMLTYNPASSPQSQCQNGINAGWHACGVAKANFPYQDCAELTNSDYAYGYSGFAKNSDFVTWRSAGNFPTCSAANAVVCCSPTCSGW